MTLETQQVKLEINKYIRKAALNKKEIFDSYRRLCEIHGNLDYVDFEWKYYQYYHGNRDLTIERSLEKSSPVTFSDLPMDVLEKVVGESDLPACLTLRKVSHDLRNLVDSSEIRCPKVFFYLDNSSVHIILETFSFGYHGIADGGCTIFVDHPMRGNKSFKDDRSFQQAMNADVSTFLKNPKLKIDEIGFTLNSNKALLEFVEFLQSLNFQLDVRSIDTNADTVILPVLQLMKPKTLETISFDVRYLKGEQVEKLVEMEQWKLAKTLNWKGPAHEFRMENLTHFKEIHIKNYVFSSEHLKALRDVLLKSAHLESCYLEPKKYVYDEYFDSDSSDDFEDDEEEDEVEERIDRIMSQNSAFDAKTRRFSILNTRDYFQLKFERLCGAFHALSIKKVSGI